MADPIHRIPSSMLQHGAETVEQALNTFADSALRIPNGPVPSVVSTAGNILADASGNGHALTEVPGVGGVGAQENCAVARFGLGKTFQSDGGNNNANYFYVQDAAFASLSDKAFTFVFRAGASMGGSGTALGGPVVADGEINQQSMVLNCTRVAVGQPFNFRYKHQDGSVTDTGIEAVAGQLYRGWVKRTGSTAKIKINGTVFTINSLPALTRTGDGVHIGRQLNATGPNGLQDGAIFSVRHWVGAVPDDATLDALVATSGDNDLFLDEGETSAHLFEPIVSQPTFYALIGETDSGGSWSFDLSSFGLNTIYDVRAQAVTAQGIAMVESIGVAAISGTVKNFSGTNLSATTPLRLMVLAE